MEKDDEIKGVTGSMYTTHFRGLDTRLGRWWSLDSKMRSNISMYTAFSNNPIIKVDPRGDDDYFDSAGNYLFTTTTKTEPVKVVNPNAPKMTFESEVVDYGTIEQDANGVREFKFTNTGKEPLIISNARGSCGCTVPTWPKEPIKPGESSVIKVKYDTKRLGAINKSVTITSNAATKVVRIKGKIIAPKTSPIKETQGLLLKSNKYRLLIY